MKTRNNAVPIRLMDLLQILKDNKKWLTISELRDEMNASSIVFDYNLERELVSYDDVRMIYLPTLQQDTNIQINYGTIISSTRGIMMTNDIELINNYIEVEEARIRGIAIKLKSVRASKKRLQEALNYSTEIIGDTKETITTEALQDIANENGWDNDYFTDLANQYCTDNDLEWESE